MFDFDFSFDEEDIGLGYRNICYQTIDRQPSIILFGFSKKTGKPKNFIIPHTCKAWYAVQYKTGFKDMYGRACAVREFASNYERKNWLKSIGNLSIVEALPPESEFLQEKFGKFILDPAFNKQKLRIHYIDIETEVSDQFEKPRNARNRINMITVFDTQEEKYFTWSLQKAKAVPGSQYVLKCFNDNEKALLQDFIQWSRKNFPDVVSGWNIKAFDIPYIFRRVENVLGGAAAKLLSPVNNYWIKEPNRANPRQNVAADIEVQISGISQLDLLLLYRDKFQIRQSLDGGYNLSNVGLAEDLGSKAQHEEEFKDFYVKNYQKFYEYNVRDVELAAAIDKKCKIIDLARMIVSFGLSKYETIYGSIAYLVGTLIAYAKNNFGCILCSYTGNADEVPDESYQGAFVFPTIPGRYSKGIATVDFNSLYPNTIISINLSPETYVGKLAEDWFDPRFSVFHLKLAHKRNAEVKEISREKLQKLISEKLIVTKNSTLFLKHSVQWGIISSWSRDFYALRKSTKKKMAAAEHKLNTDKTISEAEKASLKAEAEVLHTTQIGIKNMLNSVYGMFGSKWSPFYDIDLAQTITMQGRFCNISASEHIRQCFEHRYGIPKDYIVSISGDTDSVFSSTKISIKH